MDRTLDLVATVNELRSRVATLERLGAARWGTTTDEWITVSAFSNSFANYGSGYQGARYRRFGRTVEIQGMVARAGAPATVFTLPAGFRPAAIARYSSVVAGSVTLGLGLIDIDPSGTVTIAHVTSSGNVVAAALGCMFGLD